QAQPRPTGGQRRRWRSRMEVGRTGGSRHRIMQPACRRSRAAFQVYSRDVPPDRALEAVVTSIATPLGPMVAAATDEGVCLLEFPDHRILETQVERLRRRVAPTVAAGNHPHLSALRAHLARYYDASLPDLSAPLASRRP